MKYKNLISKLEKEKCRHIVVTGPQRAGTRFAAKIIAKDLNISFVDELDFNIEEFEVALKVWSDLQQFVMQAPALSHFLHLFPKDTIIVFMYRDPEDVVKSQKRINGGSGHEKVIREKYQKMFSKRLLNNKIDVNQTQSKLKYAVGNKIQKPLLTEAGYTYFELDYESMKEHPDWISKKCRKNFKASQTQLTSL